MLMPRGLFFSISFHARTVWLLTISHFTYTSAIFFFCCCCLRLAHDCCLYFFFNFLFIVTCHRHAVISSIL
uniref:Uncharacterized protein n=1 Tax=Anopheles darlingi TaxID=43151 RepID=A0A2M4DC82_ANODA